MSNRPIWAEISLPNLRYNFTLLRGLVAPEAEVLAVVKADGYGHGAAPCALALQEAGARWFGVTSYEEGELLREAGVSGRILVMSGFLNGDRDGEDCDCDAGNRAPDALSSGYPEQQNIIERGLTPAVWNVEQIRALEDAATALKMPPASIAVHLKIDTGMSRLGSDWGELRTIATRTARAVWIEGVFSHFASSEVVHGSSVAAQFHDFQKALAELARLGIHPQFVHMANSAAIFTHPASRKTIMEGARVLVRPGIALYGYVPEFQSQCGSTIPPQPELKPVLAWKTRIISLKDLPPGRAVGYGGTYITPVQTKLAILPVGYADGLNRRLSPRGHVLVRGERANIVGNISMDLTTVDATHIPGVNVGDEVVLIGEQGGRRITAWDQAHWAEMIPYEVLCGLSKRVPRIYIAECAPSRLRTG